VCLCCSTQTIWAALAPYAGLGIIYVDIGTSPLYTFSTTLTHNNSNSSNGDSWHSPAKEDVLGVASLIFWILTLVVLVKYVLIVLRADDSGEGALLDKLYLCARSACRQCYSMCLLAVLVATV
jgi:KUP system potassium uptake protein